MNSIDDPVKDEIDDDNTPIPGTVFNKRQARMLKYLVITMGLMLIFGFALLVGIIAYRASQPAKPLIPMVPAGVSAPTVKILTPTNPLEPAVEAKTIQAIIPKGASYLDSTIEGRRLIITLKTKDKGLQLLLIDLKNWQIVGQASLTPGK